MHSEGMHMGGPLWLQVINDLLAPLVTSLSATVSHQVRIITTVAEPAFDGRTHLKIS